MKRLLAALVPASFLICLSLISGCSSSSSSDTPDTTAPTLSSTSPGDGAAVTSIVRATFSEGVSFDTFSLTSSSGADRSGTASGTGGTTISFTPSRSLNYGTTYTATITNVRDGEGNSAGDVSWSFTTESSAPSSYHKTPDSTINDIGKYNSMALGTDGRSYISYLNATNGTLYVISTRDGTNFGGPYQVSPLGGAGGDISNLVVDSSGRFHIAFLRSSGGLDYVTAAEIGSWSAPVTVDANPGTGKYPSLAVDTNGIVHISYYDETNTALKYANNSGGTWIATTLDSGLDGENPGQYTSIKVAGDGTVHISYYDSVLGNLKYYNPSLTPTTSTPDSTGDVGAFSLLYVDSDGIPYIFYNYVSAADGGRRIRVITTASGQWQHFDIVSVSGSALTSNPVAIDSEGVMHLGYFADGSLYYISGILLDADANSWDWSSPMIVDSSGIGNGIYTSIIADSTGKAQISYYDYSEGDLKFAK